VERFRLSLVGQLNGVVTLLCVRDRALSRSRRRALKLGIQVYFVAFPFAICRSAAGVHEQATSEHLPPIDLDKLSLLL
jgi:hypothetical protein